jgi:hypothetical protein
MIDKEFIPYQEALELKQLGFDEPCFTYYKNDRPSDVLELVKNSEIQNVNNEPDDFISAPTYSQAFRWFREKYGLASQFAYYHVPKWTFEILEFTDIKMTPSKIVVEYSKPRTYEEAELACLKKLIEIVKGGNK